ncbi:YceI family protein [Sedimentitalea todarodis]|uniref:YceI family protein n=1 Tax=Sedimentitalea todarodis TaxID=1631240 RepID=A0ABU3VDX0_9RHOB|nr:YceI family protein [Sedimentitalea todarodis]MDU9004368.1 YceI family protein [Sedimentitalea todarodis]
MRFLAAAALTLAATSVQAAPAQYSLDPEHTLVAFTVEHIGYARVLGVFSEVSGTFTYDAETQELSDVSVTVGAASVDTFHDARNGHVNAGDFLDTGNFREITFTASEGSPLGENSGTVTGDLSMLGQSHPVTLDVTLNKAAEYPFGHKKFTLGLSITAEIMRSEWGMTYAVENGLVGDAVSILIETEATLME